ncbi:DUF6241 domain-containing protein [Proteiniclasticum sp. C24MP]|uniref:DUF6241 domain-containing protein n=1 Tax=Proteiniclasticum sp. C24MP TaxID=3374101 RepID=UPI003755129F
MSKRIRGSIVLIVVIFIIGFWLIQSYKPVVRRITTSVFRSGSDHVSQGEDRDLLSLYTDIHHMSHNVVIAEDKWGYKDLTLENIDQLLIKVEEFNGRDEIKEEVFDILQRWKNGDFSRAHNNHSYVWIKLGGTVGKATGVNTMTLPDWAVEE